MAGNEEEPFEDPDEGQNAPEASVTTGWLDASTLLIDPTRRKSSPFQVIVTSSPKVGPTGLELREEYLSPTNISPTATAATAAATSLQASSYLVAEPDPLPSSGLVTVNSLLIRRHSVSPRREPPAPVVPKPAPESASSWHGPWSGSKPAAPPVLPAIPEVVSHTTTTVIMAPPALPPAPVPQNVHCLLSSSTCLHIVWLT